MSAPFYLHRFLLPLLFLCAWLAPRALAGDLPRPGAVGDGGHLWLAAPAPDAKDGWQVLHHQPGQTGFASPVPGGIAAPQALPDGSAALCAKGGTLYVAGMRPDGQGIEVEELEVGLQTDQRLVLTRRTLGQLPAQAKVLAMAADGQGVWLAVSASSANLSQMWHVSDGRILARAKAQFSAPLDLALDLPPGTVGEFVVKIKEVKKEEASDFSKEKKVFLLKSNGNGMVLVNLRAPLPLSDWAMLAGDGAQLLFAPSAGTLWLGRPDAWHPFESPGPFTHALFVGGQPVLAQVAVKQTLTPAAWANAVRVDWSVLRDARSPAGACELPLGDGEGYSLVVWQGHAALARVSSVFKPDQLAVTLAPVDLQGGALPVEELRQVSDPQAHQSGILWLQSAVVLLALVLMGWTWRRGPRLLPQLPAQYRRAGLLPRGFAALMDLALVAVPVAQYFGIEVADILRHWPGVGMPVGLAQLKPGFVVCALFILHTMVAEMLFGRSLGKAFMGLRVVDLKGGRPALWRVFLRGILKWLELLSIMLLIVAVFSPFGQRLGDLVSGTVVVAKARKPGDPA